VHKYLQELISEATEICHPLLNPLHNNTTGSHDVANVAIEDDVEPEEEITVPVVPVTDVAQPNSGREESGVPDGAATETGGSEAQLDEVHTPANPTKIKRGIPLWYAGKVSPAFASHMFWPSPPKRKKPRSGMLLPAAASTETWRHMYMQKKNKTKASVKNGRGRRCLTLGGTNGEVNELASHEVCNETGGKVLETANVVAKQKPMHLKGQPKQCRHKQCDEEVKMVKRKVYQKPKETKQQVTVATTLTTRRALSVVVCLATAKGRKELDSVQQMPAMGT